MHAGILLAEMLAELFPEPAAAASNLQLGFSVRLAMSLLLSWAFPLVCGASDVCFALLCSALLGTVC